MEKFWELSEGTWESRRASQNFAGDSRQFGGAGTVLARMFTVNLGCQLENIPVVSQSTPVFFFFFITLGLELSDTKVYEP